MNNHRSVKIWHLESSLPLYNILSPLLSSSIMVFLVVGFSRHTLRVNDSKWGGAFVLHCDLRKFHKRQRVGCCAQFMIVIETTCKLQSASMQGQCSNEFLAKSDSYRVMVPPQMPDSILLWPKLVRLKAFGNSGSSSLDQGPLEFATFCLYV